VGILVKSDEQNMKNRCVATHVEIWEAFGSSSKAKRPRAFYNEWLHLQELYFIQINQLTWKSS